MLTKRNFIGLSMVSGVLAMVVAAAAASLPVPVSKEDLARRSVLDPRVRQYVTPSRIVWMQKDDKALIENETLLLRPFNGQVTLDSRVGCVLRHKGKAPAILLDFGRELHGGIQIAVSDLQQTGKESKTVKLRVRFGESVSEAMSDVGGEKNPTNDHAVRDQTCLVPWLGTHEVGNTGFRFVRIDLLDENTFVTLKAVRAVFLYRDLPYLGSFQCNDARLNQIWETGAYTVHLNMQDYVWDGIKRDRLVWIGDMHPETMTISSVFGDCDVVRRSLDLIRDDTPLPKWMNGISSYSMWWVLIHHSGYRFHGDLDYLKQQQAYLTSLLRELMKHIGPDNGEKLPPGRFLDWPTSENAVAIHAGLHSLLIMTLEAGADLLKDLRDKELQAECKEAAARLRKHVPNHGGSKQAAALMALAGIGDAEVLNRSVMALDGPKRMSTFYGYYVLEARAKAGDYQGCLDVIREYWGAMLDYGATTFWEDFNIEWTQNAARIDEIVPPDKKDIHGDYGNYCYQGLRHSLCHGWASGPTAWMSEHILGIQVLEPGFKKIRIIPHLGDLKWAEGTFPTPHGIIHVRHDLQPDGKIKTTYKLPQGVKLVKP